jgi:hypothetical protein
MENQVESSALENTIFQVGSITTLTAYAPGTEAIPCCSKLLGTA